MSLPPGSGPKKHVIPHVQKPCQNGVFLMTCLGGTCFPPCHYKSFSGKRCTWACVCRERHLPSIMSLQDRQKPMICLAKHWHFSRKSKPMICSLC